MPYTYDLARRVKDAVRQDDRFIFNLDTSGPYTDWLRTVRPSRIAITDIDAHNNFSGYFTGFARGMFRIHEGLVDFDMSGCQIMASLPDNFLANLGVNFDWRHFWRVEEIGRKTFFSMSGMRRFDGRALLSLRKLGQGFASESDMTACDFRGLSGLKELPAGMFMKAKAYGREAVVSTEGLEGVRRIGDDAFSYTDWVEINFLGLPNVEEIGEKAFSVSAFRVLGFAPMQRLRKLGAGSFGKLRNLVRLELRGLENLEVLKGDNFSECAQLESVVVSDCPELRKIGDNCFSSNKELRAAEFIRLPKLEDIGNGVLAYTPKLEEVVFADVPALSILGDSVLGNSGVRVIDLSNAEGLRKVGANFAARSPNLEAVVFGDVVLERIGEGYLRDCRQLTEPGWLAMRGLQEIPSGIVRGCRRLIVPGFDVFRQAIKIGDECFYAVGGIDTSAGLTPLEDVTEVGDRFLANARIIGDAAAREGLFDVFKNLEKVGDCFAYGIRMTRAVIKWPKIRSLGGQFMAGSDVEQLNIVAPQLQHVGSDFMAQSKVKGPVVFDPRTRLLTLGANFFKGCDGFEGVRSADGSVVLQLLLQDLEHGIPAGFFEGCASLPEGAVVLPLIKGEVGERFLMGCRKVISLPAPTWAAFRKVRKIGGDFMAGTGIERADYEDLQHMGAVKEIGPNFMQGTPLRVIDLDALEGVEKIGKGFCADTRILHWDISAKISGLLAAADEGDNDAASDW